MKVEDARPHFFKIIRGEDIKQHLVIHFFVMFVSPVYLMIKVSLLAPADPSGFHEASAARNAR